MVDENQEITFILIIAVRLVAISDCVLNAAKDCANTGSILVKALEYVTQPWCIQLRESHYKGRVGIKCVECSTNCSTIIERLFNK